MNRLAVLSGEAGLEGVQWAIKGPSARRLLRSGIRQMLRPGCALGPLRLTRAKYKPNQRINAYYTLTAGEAGAWQTRPIAVTWTESPPPAQEEVLCAMQEEAARRGLLAPFAQLWKDLPAHGIRVLAWPLDPDFPHLARLGDPETIPGVLAAAGIQGNGAGERFAAVTPVRYRPGERHVLRYDLAPTGGSGPGQKYYAKLYPSSQAAARTYRVANRVADWLDEQPGTARAIRPAGWSEADAAILYHHAPGNALSKQLGRSPGWVAAQMRSIGATLAALHGGPETLTAELGANTIEKEVKVIRRASEHVQVLLPEVGALLFDLLDRALALHQGMPQEPPTFTHSDFKCDHLLTHKQGLALIDFDTCALADPALDLGKFLADLEWWHARVGAPGVERAQAAFLEGYPRRDAPGRLQRARVYHALILAKITLRRAKISARDWAETTKRMIVRADEVLNQLS